jgi:hypothetical protein
MVTNLSIMKLRFTLPVPVRSGCKLYMTFSEDHTFNNIELIEYQASSYNVIASGTLFEKRDEGTRKIVIANCP